MKKSSKYQLDECLVQLWTESKSSISGNVPRASPLRGDALPEFISRLIVFDLAGNKPNFISVPCRCFMLHANEYLLMP
jgi:hypothetical protein